LTEALKTLESRYDYLIMDTGAGVGDTVLSFVQAAQQSIVVISPEPTSLTDAFSLIKVLKNRGIDKPLHILVNMALNRENSLEVFHRFENAVTKYLQKKVNYLGYIPLDENIITSVSLQQPVIIQKPTSDASCSFFELATLVAEKILPDASSTSFSDSLQESFPALDALPEERTASLVQAVAELTPTELLNRSIE
jgi:flagellar biosynthesis protein FlhG